MRLTVTTTRLDDSRPLLALAPEQADTIAWLRHGDGFVAWGDAATLEPADPKVRFTDAHDLFSAAIENATITDTVGVPGGGLMAFGSFTFADVPGSKLRIPQMIVGRRDGVTWHTVITNGTGPLSDPPLASNTSRPTPKAHKPRFAGSTNPDVHWLDAVQRARDAIIAGKFDKVVLARDYAVWSYEPFSPLTIAERLAASFPSCYTFIFDGLVGATPELLLRVKNGDVTSQVLAGTIGRDDDPAVDASLSAALQASLKDQGEHVFAVTSVVDVLARYCATLTVADTPEVLKLANVQHLASTITGTLATDMPALELVGALHPSAAVGGTPRPDALAFIQEHEGMSRGRYAAPVGYIAADGQAEWGIALRCAEVSGARARLFAGVGIVADSLPEAELAETHLKLLAMQRALASD